ncbi:hypothetical protein [Elizabethkingia anophelis]|nr:hypothetical protein [Elizabethkingia anophelis]UKY88768.1 hypothetical protein KUF64_10720 [Elizabethkingia anophelis]UKY95938.1 hypothetical protein KUF68_10740 [Elizabethkingia anophelis]
MSAKNDGNHSYNIPQIFLFYSDAMRKSNAKNSLPIDSFELVRVKLDTL